MNGVVLRLADTRALHKKVGWARLRSGQVSKTASVITKLQQLVNQRFRLVRRDAGVAIGQWAFARVQHGLQFFQRR